MRFQQKDQFWPDSVLKMDAVSAQIRCSGPSRSLNFDIYRPWSELVRDFILILVPVRAGPRFYENIWSRSESVRDFLKIFGPGPSWSRVF